MSQQTLREQINEANVRATEALVIFVATKSAASADEFIKWNNERSRLLQELAQEM